MFRSLTKSRANICIFIWEVYIREEQHIMLSNLIMLRLTVGERSYRLRYLAQVSLRPMLCGRFKQRQQWQNPVCCGCQVGYPVRARRRICNNDMLHHGDTKPTRFPTTTSVATSDKRWELWQNSAKLREVPSVIPWRLAPSFVLASTQTVAPILLYRTG